MALPCTARPSRRTAPLLVVAGALVLLCRDAQAQGTRRARAATDAAADAGRDAVKNEDLIRMGQGLLGNGDLLRMGEGLIQHPAARRHGASAAGTAVKGGAAIGAGAASRGADGGAGADAEGAPDLDRGRDAAGAGERDGAGPLEGASADGGLLGVSADGGLGGASVDDAPAPSAPGNSAGTLGGLSSDPARAPSAAGSGAVATSGAPPPPSASPSTGPLGFGMPRSARIAAGKEMAPKGAESSPLRALGIPTSAVPAVATIAAIGGMAIWPFLLKTLTSLFKGFIAARLKRRAKKTRKLDTAARAFLVGGFRIRPAELGAVLVAAIVYGLAVSYAYQGRKLQGRFVLGQECLVLAIYYARSMARFAYERAYKLPTQYKLWVGGAFLCLGSAYLGNTLGTVGFEVDSAKSPEETERMVKLKAWLIVLALAAALGFFVANLHAPAKMLQSGRLMMSGTALAEVLPFDPMPGLKIYKWRPFVWIGLMIAVVPTFFLINFVW